MEIPNSEVQRCESSGAPATVKTDTDGTTTVLLFGKTGDGKSTLGNMILTEEDNPRSGISVPFAVGDSLTAVTKGLMRKEESQSRKWQVIDTVGLLSSDNDRTDEKLAKELYDELHEEQHSIHWLCYVKKATKFTKADERCWQQFKRRFGEYTSNIILVFTSCQKDSWIKENEAFIKEHMGDDAFRKVCVNFPPPDDDPSVEQVLERKRTESRKKLQTSLLDKRPSPIVLKGREKKVTILRHKAHEHFKDLQWGHLPDKG